MSDVARTGAAKNGGGGDGSARGCATSGRLSPLSCPQPFITAVMGRFRASACGHRRRTALGVDGDQESLRILGRRSLGVERAACPRSTGLLPLPDLCSGEVHDATLVKFLLRQTLLLRTKEEDEKEQFLEQSLQELRLLSETPLAGRSLQQTRRMMELLKLRDAASSSSSKRKRKKRRKKTPRTSSSCGRAHRRQRQWWLRWFSAYAVSPSFVGWPELPSIMAGMNQKDSIHCARGRLRQWHMQGWFCWCCTSRCVPSCSRQSPDAQHHGRYEPEGELCGEMVVVIPVVP